MAPRRDVGAPGRLRREYFHAAVGTKALVGERLGSANQTEGLVSLGGALHDSLFVGAPFRVHLLVVRSVEVGILLPAAGTEGAVVGDGIATMFVRQNCLLGIGAW